MEIKLFNFSKKVNSTKQPSLSAGTSVDVKLKEATSIENPVFLLTGNVTSAYNYCYALGHYYFIDNITQITNSVFEISCTQDLLATYKSGIGSTSAYVSRSASAYNGAINDTMYPTIADITSVQNSIDDLYDTNGCYIMGVIGNNNLTLSSGSVCYYALNQTQMDSFVAGLYQQATWQTLTDNYGEPLNYITSCVWIPLNVATGSTTTIILGYNSIPNSSAYVVNAKTFSNTKGGITVPKHPKASSKGSYLNMSPYSTYSIDSTVFGRVPLPNSYLNEVDSISVTLRCDLYGNSMLSVEAGSKTIQRVTGNAGVQIQLAKMVFATRQEKLAYQSSLLSLGTNVFNKNVSGSLGSALSVYGAIQDMEQADLSTSGSNGSFIGAAGLFQLKAVFFDITPEDNTRYGRPLCEVKQLSTLSGFILCENAVVELACLGNDRQAINNYLNSGFYYE